ncbi:MAG: hypothetical protein GWN96_07595 [candidate division Zixibacteria bacterium]|nr:hypothetical protein [Phycisphaerae bacterium]NIS16079.1 hypothetical protein [candidate division Zixibacteria bacterium]
MNGDDPKERPNNVPEDRQITMEPPDSCIGCGWKPRPETDSMSDRMTWLELCIPQSVVWIYVCPRCGAAMGNKNAYANVQKLKSIKESRIVQAKPNMVRGLNPLMPGRN